VLPASRPQTELTQTIMAENAALRAKLAATKKDAERVPAKRVPAKRVRSVAATASAAGRRRSVGD
jgi:hypothetical protein